MDQPISFDNFYDRMSKMLNQQLMEMAEMGISEVLVKRKVFNVIIETMDRCPPELTDSRRPLEQVDVLTLMFADGPMRVRSEPCEHLNRSRRRDGSRCDDCNRVFFGKFVE